MKIAPAAAERFAANFMQEAPRIALCYGPDAGAAALLAEKMRASFANAHPDGEMLRFAYDNVKADPASFRDELYALSFFSTYKCFQVSGCAGTIDKSFLDTLESYEGEHKIIVTAGDLTPSSPLRKLAEKHAHIAALACYKDDNRSAGAYISGFFKEENITIDRDALTLLTHALPGDRMTVRRELEKLLLYAHGETRITVKHIEDVIALDGEAPLNALCNAVFEGNIQTASASYRTFLSENGAGSGVAVIRAAQTRVKRLLDLSGAMLQGGTPEQAVEQAKPKIFFKDAPSFVKQLRRYDGKKLRAVLFSLQEAEILLKSTLADPDTACMHALLAVCRAGR